MSQGQDALYWMPHKQDYEMFGAGDDTEIPRNNQEQLVIPVGNCDSACHTFTVIYYVSKTGRME